MTTNLDLWPIGNCQVSALIDRAGHMVWGCLPRVDGEPIFSSLLSGVEPGEDGAAGLWAIELDGCVKTEQDYVRNTPILVTRHEDAAGNAIEVTDFCPRYTNAERTYRPVAYARIVRPVAGSPRIRIRLRPTRGWGNKDVATTAGSHHIRYTLDGETVRLSTDAARRLSSRKSACSASNARSTSSWGPTRASRRASSPRSTACSTTR